MFEQTFVNDSKSTKEPFAFGLSVVLESCAIGLLVLLPLIYSQGLPSAQLKSLLTVPPPPTVAPKVPTEVKQQHIVAARRFSALIAPRVVPKQINTNIQELRPAPDVMVSGGGTGTSNATDKLLSGVIGSVPEPPAPVHPAKRQPPSGPMRISTGIAEANLIHKVMPIYPALAKSARVQGTVEFTATISKEGVIENLRLVRGHPLLVQAARDAVLQWRYRPTLLNGQPVEVVTDIIVHFTLSE